MTNKTPTTPSVSPLLAGRLARADDPLAELIRLAEQQHLADIRAGLARIGMYARKSRGGRAPDRAQAARIERVKAMASTGRTKRWAAAYVVADEHLGPVGFAGRAAMVESSARAILGQRDTSPEMQRLRLLMRRLYSAARRL